MLSEPICAALTIFCAFADAATNRMATADAIIRFISMTMFELDNRFFHVLFKIAAILNRMPLSVFTLSTTATTVTATATAMAATAATAATAAVAATAATVAATASCAATTVAATTAA